MDKTLVSKWAWHRDEKYCNTRARENEKIELIIAGGLVIITSISLYFEITGDPCDLIGS